VRVVNVGGTGNAGAALVDELERADDVDAVDDRGLSRSRRPGRS
jgi:nucleoside-diphosphate-sugar epimerase